MSRPRGGHAQTAILDHVATVPDGATAYQIHEATGLPLGSVRHLTRLLYERGQLCRHEVPATVFHGFRSRVGAMGREGVWCYRVPCDECQSLWRDYH